MKSAQMQKVTQEENCPVKKTSKPRLDSGYKVHEEKAVCLDKLVTTIIQGLDMYIGGASSAGAGTVARILATAKEDLIYWAVSMDFHETNQEAFINRLLHNNAMFLAADFLNSLAAVKNKKQLFEALENDDLKAMPFALIEKLRATM